MLKIKNLNKSFGGLKAVNAVNLKVDKGEYIAILGPSGSGKSTLMNMIGCLDSPTSGEYILDRSDVSCLWDLTTHDVSILNAITPNEPTQIRASSFNTSQTEAFDMVNVSLNYENNLFVTMFSSWLHPEKTRKIKIVGDKKMIVFDDLNFNEPIKIYDKKFDQIYDKDISQNNNNSFFSFSILFIVAKTFGSTFAD